MKPIRWDACIIPTISAGSRKAGAIIWHISAWIMTKMEAAGVISPVLTVEAAYHSMTRYGEEVSIEVTVKKYNGVKIFLGYHIRDKKDGTLRCSGQTSHCFLNREGKPLSLKKEKPEWHEILKRECERAQEQNG